MMYILSHQLIADFPDSANGPLPCSDPLFTGAFPKATHPLALFSVVTQRLCPLHLCMYPE